MDYEDIDRLYRDIQSVSLALQYLNEMVDEGDPEAMARLARAYRDGRGVERDLQKALKLLNDAESKGITWASRDKLDVLWGMNTPDSLAEFVRLSEKLVQNGDPEAMARLARAYRDGKSVQKDYSISEKLLRDAERKGNKYAKYELLDLYKCIGTTQAEKKYYESSKKLHESGDYNGTLRLARAYRDGCGTIKNIPLSIELYNQAIAHNIDVSDELNREVLIASNFEKIPENIGEIYNEFKVNISTNGIMSALKNRFDYWIKLLNKNLVLPEYEQVLSAFIEKTLQRPITTIDKIKAISKWNRNALFLYHFVGEEIALSKPIGGNSFITKSHLSDNQLNILMIVGGGIGDILVEANYIYKFREKFGNNCIIIDVVSNNGRSLTNIFKRGLVIDDILEGSNYEKYLSSYDCYLDLGRRYPRMFINNSKKIISFEPELMHYYHTLQCFADTNEKLMKGDIFDYQATVIEIIKGRKRIHQPDIGGYLNIKEKYEYPLFINEHKDYLKKIGLNPGEYVTIHRGADVAHGDYSVKMWPLEYYSKLINKIKEHYPDITIVQLGISENRCPKVDGVDMYLVGKTNLEQVKLLLKNAFTHIDVEGGMAHIRHALCGKPSIILFGPTSPDFYGYSENINIVSTRCCNFCEWVTPNWNEKCIKGDVKNECMYSIAPERVFMEFVKLRDSSDN